MRRDDVVLTIDGRPLERKRLAGLVARAARAAVALGAGPGTGVVVGAGDPLATVVGAAVAEATGAAIVHAPDPSGAPGRATVPGGVRLRGASEEVEVELARTAPGAAPLPAAAGAVLWTSGSGGPRRAVLLPRDGLAWHVRATAQRLGVDASDELLLPLPVHHAYGFSVVELARATGAVLHLQTSPSARRVARRLKAGGVTALDGFPSLYRGLLALAEDDAPLASALASLRVRGCGGDLLDPALARACAARVDAPLHDGYGLTEAGPNVALSGPGRERAGTVGPPLDGAEVRVGADGELLVRSPAVMLGYLGDAAATADALDGGWLRTGDVGRLDEDGHVIVAGRAKHVIVVHGACHSPTEIEAAARGCGAVADAVAVGAAGGHRLGDRITLYVSPADAAASAERLRRCVASACREQLPVHLRPHAVVVLDALPRGATGKADRDLLRRRAEAAR